MRNLRLLFLFGLATGFISEKLFVSSQTTFSTTDDLYLEGRTSGGLPIDDEDGDDGNGSGSGSGDYASSNFTDTEEILRKVLNFSQTTVSKEMVSTQPPPSAASPLSPSTTATGSQNPSTTATGSQNPSTTATGSQNPSTTATGSQNPSTTATGSQNPSTTATGSQNPSTTATGSQNPSTTATGSQNPSTTATGSQNPSTKVTDAETTSFVLPDGDNSDESTSSSSTAMHPSETTATTSGIDVTVINQTDKDNSLDMWDVSTPRNRGDEVLIKVVENEILPENGRGRKFEMGPPEEVTSENMWERTEVLAAVIACGVVGFLCAVFLLLLLTYRMKKKDEGSYDLGDTKVSTTAYHKAPTKEFYA